jgi:flagellar basal-body rod protein FlgC
MSLLSAISVASSGMAAQRARAEVLVENMANAETTRTPDGGPYRRKQVIFTTEAQGSPFSAVFHQVAGETGSGVGIAEIAEDLSDPELRYLPGHPDANEDGYVAFPKANPMEDMVDLMGASRGYQANVAAISAVKDMVHRTLDLMR